MSDIHLFGRCLFQEDDNGLTNRRMLGAMFHCAPFPELCDMMLATVSLVQRFGGVFQEVGHISGATELAQPCLLEAILSKS